MIMMLSQYEILEMKNEIQEDFRSVQGDGLSVRFNRDGIMLKKLYVKFEEKEHH